MKKIVAKRKILLITLTVLLAALSLGIVFAASAGSATSSSNVPNTMQTLNANADNNPWINPRMRDFTPQQKNALRKAAADRLQEAVIGIEAAVPGPDSPPDYFGIYPNYATSPLPIVDPFTGQVSGGIRKFVDSLPGLGPENANNLGQYIPVAQNDTTTYPGSDYYEIALVEYQDQMHSDLPNNTTFRGYVQVSTAKVPGLHIQLNYTNGTPIRNATGGIVYGVDKPHYMGPAIIAYKDKPVRIKFTNYLPTGSGGDLFLPVDTTIMGAGMGPLGENYKQNRATIHLHGGRTPWISDGTVHQWTTPAGETTAYPKGVSVAYVPDMWFNPATGATVPAGTPGATPATDR